MMTTEELLKIEAEACNREKVLGLTQKIVDLFGEGESWEHETPQIFPVAHCWEGEGAQGVLRITMIASDNRFLEEEEGLRVEYGIYYAGRLEVYEGPTPTTDRGPFELALYLAAEIYAMNEGVG